MLKTWMDLEDSILGEISLPQKAKHFMVPLRWGIESSCSEKQKWGWRGPGAGEEGRAGELFKG